MTARAHLNRYLESWRLGDGRHGLPVITSGFQYDDPNSTVISRDGFVQFVEDFKSAAAELNGGIVPDPFLTYSNIVVDSSTELHTAWCWWQATGTPLQGAALVTFDDTGILSEKVAYYSRLPVP